ncbi:outer dynein arm-docking complex subunit 3-like isoform X1 [Acipenser ruthenus]|uniref:outer dynein arm-docking complex subunit 3-like isoform X1 n=1 Tax=Acipenser ruthenus TaxID=7906 RepID=UPI0027406AF7|nr:outer dynein arm-docking complex subunit 3-like isoform X1 [Acipenser ruthenus]
MPVTTNNADGIRPPLHEQISELQRKIQLLEGDRKAYYESSQWTIKKNKESILQLRKENKKLHKKLADTLAGDDRVIKDAFCNRNVEKNALRNKTGQAAIQIVDHKVCDKVKQLNALKHSTETRRRRLQELQWEYNRKTQGSPGASLATYQAEMEESKNEGESPAEQPQQNLRSLENRLEKAQLKCQEAEHIMKVYLKLKEHLQEESLTFQNKLDSMEAEILRQRQELRELQGMNSDAQLSKDAAKAELQHQEEVVYRERRQRDKILNELRKQAEERKAQAERVERRAQRAIMQPDDQSTEAQRSGVDEENTITTFEEAFERIKEATGVTNTQEVVERFISQGDTQRHLELLKVENEKTLEQLKEEREKLRADFQEMKYSGEAKLSSGQQVLEEFASHLREEEKRRDEARERLDRLTRVLSTVRAGVEHLGDKLQHVKIPRGHVPAAQLPPSSEEYVLELLSVSEQKLLQLLEELQGKELNDILKEMEEAEFNASIEGKLPAYNMRISLPESHKQDLFDEDEVSSDEDPDVISRTALKRQSQQIIDSRTKRKTRPKKKKGKQ